MAISPGVDCRAHRASLGEARNDGEGNRGDQKDLRLTVNAKRS
jgi:hypothetical protein